MLGENHSATEWAEAHRSAHILKRKKPPGGGLSVVFGLTKTRSR
jgi:hypothetical protein